jgi:alkylation response protein AidB-like acyl-CoA dehydrogenase
MDVRFTDEQRALRTSAAQIVDRLGPRAVRDLEDDARTGRLEAAVADAGWRSLRAAGDDGAPWASGVEVALVAEELARGLADAPFLGPTLAADLRRLAGADEASQPETVALRPDLSSLAVPGVKTVAVDAGGARSALVPTPDGTVWSAALDGTTALDGTGVDLTRPSVPIDGSTSLAPVGAVSIDDLQRWTALGLAVTTADLVGTMRGAIDLSVGYAKQREQFGRTIGSFQAVAHLLADARVHLEGARAASLHASWAVDALDPPDAVAAAAAAKAYAARAAREVCEIAIQVHGGIGNTWECLAHVYLRRALLATDVLGGVGPNLARVLEHAGVGGRV